MEQPIGELHDVVLHEAADATPAMLPRIAEGVVRDALAPRPGDELEALEDFVGLPVLDAGVQVLFVLAHDDHVHRGVACGHEGGQCQAGPDVGVQAQRFAQRDVQAFVPAALRRADRGLEQHLRATDAGPGLGGNARVVSAQVDGLADVDELGFDAGASGFQHAERGAHDLGADAVAAGHGDGHSGRGGRAEAGQRLAGGGHGVRLLGCCGCRVGGLQERTLGQISASEK